MGLREVLTCWQGLFLYAVLATSPSMNGGERYAAMLAELQMNSTLVNFARKSLLASEGASDTHLVLDFPCHVIPPSTQIPTSVHELRPGDIKIVAGLGDSITAGRGAASRALTSLLYDFRGFSWSAGGEESFHTFQSLPNILKLYNPQLYGFSTGRGRPESKSSKFNVAKSGARSNDLMHQTSQLLEKMKNDPKVNFQEDWKHITLFIGGNDLCQECEGEPDNSPEWYLKHLTEALGFLQDNFPRTFVSLVEILPIEQIQELNSNIVCSFLHRRSCECAAFPKTETARRKLKHDRKKYQHLTEQMVTSGQFDTSDDFTVVLQPMMRELEVPRLPSGDVDYSLMAADCFHFSRKGHALAGIGLWNNLMQPVGKKAAFVDFGTTVHCPDEDRPFLATRRNSVLGLQLGADGPSSNSTTPRASSSKSNTTKKYAAPVVAISALIAMSLVATGLAFWRKKTNNHRLYEKI